MFAINMPWLQHFAVMMNLYKSTYYLFYLNKSFQQVADAFCCPQQTHISSSLQTTEYRSLEQSKFGS